ncbi:MAG: hypothetical protein LBE24_01730 [Methylobacillus sp.]|nr:hypothetical protein [Methylobacillus sp.]
MQTQLDILVASLNEFWTQFANFVPKVFAALIILFIGWLVARLARGGMLRLLRFVHFDTVAQKSGFESFLQQGDLNLTLSGIISQIVYWLVILMFVITGANMLGLQDVSGLLVGLAKYLPNIIVAILVLIFGTLLARFINRIVFAWLHSIKFDGALMVSTSAEYLVQVFVLFVALEQLNIGTQLLTALFIIVVGAVFLALAIAFGLGGKEWASKVIQEMQDNARKK